MSPLTFQLYMYWFRVLREARLLLRRIRATVEAVAPQTIRGLFGLRAKVLAPLWRSFMLYIWFWETLERRTRDGFPLRTWQRGLYCVGLSLAIGLGLTLLLGPGLRPITLFLAGTHGVIVFLTWKRGARQLGKFLGVRPMRFDDPGKAYQSMDFGN